MHDPVPFLLPYWREIQLILSTPGVFLQNSSTLDLVSRRHTHNYFIPVLYKQKESVTQSILIQFIA